MATLFRTILYNPLYNALIWLSVVLPGHSLGLAIIILTLAVKSILLPLQHRAVRTQRKIKEIEPQIKELQKKLVGDKAEQARRVMELYKAHGINPLASFGTLLIQIPIILALFWVFRDSFEINPEVIYSFIEVPGELNPTLGMIDLSERSVWLAFLTGLTQFIQMRLALPPLDKKTAETQSGFQANFARSMNIQMRYVMPVFVFVAAISLPAAISLYWITSNLFATLHELLVKRRAEQLVAAPSPVEASGVGPTVGQ